MSTDAGEIKGKLTLDRSGFQQSIQAGVQEANEAADKLTQSLTKPYGPARDEAGRFASTLSDVAKQADQLTSEANRSTSAWSALSQVWATAGGTLLGNAIGSTVGMLQGLGDELESIGEKSIKLAADFESTELSFRVMIGDTQEADKLIADLRTFSNTTPFQFTELANAGRQLLAMGVDAKDVVTDLRMIGDVSSGLHQPIGDIAYLFGQIKSRGSASAIELRELAMRGVPIYAELAKTLHMSVEEVRKLTSEGDVSFDKIQTAFRSMTSEGGRFNNMTEQQAQMLNGLYSTLEDAIQNVQIALGTALAQGGDGKNLISEITDEINKLGPTVVDVGVELAEMFKEALPYAKTFLEYVQAASADLGLIDLNKINGNPYGKDNSASIAGADASKESIARLDRIQQGIADASKAASAGVAGLGDAGPLKSTSAVMDAADKLAKGSPDSQKQLQTINDAIAHGQKVTDDQLAKAKSSLQDNLKTIAQLQDAINQAIPDLNEFQLGQDKVPGLQALQGQLRDALKDSGRAITEFDKIAQHQKDAKAKADKDANDKTAAAPAPGSVASAARAGHEAGGKEDSFGQTFADAQIAMLEAAGDKEKAELFRLKDQFDKDLQKMAGANASGNLDDAEYAMVAAARAQQFEAASESIRKRYAEERQRDADRDTEKQTRDQHTIAEASERAQQFATEAQAAGMRERGDIFGAEMLEFDASWKRRIDAIKDGEEKATAITAYEAERRAKIREESGTHRGRGGIYQAAQAIDYSKPPGDIAEAQERLKAAGNGGGRKSELAELDMLSLQGNITEEEKKRRSWLGDRFRSPASIAGPSPLSAAAPYLQRPAAQAVRGGGSAGDSPAINQNFEVDAKKLGDAAYQGAKKALNEALQQFSNRTRDANYANGVGMNL